MDVYIAQPTTNEQAKALKAFMKALHIDFKISKKEETENPYDSAFVAKVLKSKQDFLDGKGTTVSMDELKALCK